MSLQIIELLFFAGIAFWIINKLLSVLGASYDDDPTKQTHFGECNDLKDVTNYAECSNNFDEFSHLVVANDISIIRDGLETIIKLMPSFNLERFVNGARLAYKMIIELLRDNNTAALLKLVDQKYMNMLYARREIYNSFSNNIIVDDIDCKLSDILKFGNTIFIVVIFKYSNVIEECTFKKNVMMDGNTWFVSNIVTHEQSLIK